jgi:hypothetical protein
MKNQDKWKVSFSSENGFWGSFWGAIGQGLEDFAASTADK